MKQISKKSILLIIIIITVLSQISSDIYVPLLSCIRNELCVTDVAIQRTISIYLFSIGIGSFIFGQISDAFGRRIPILSGIIMYTYGCYLSTISENIQTLYIARIIQGVGISVSWVLGNAVVKDIFSEKNCAKAMNMMHITASIVPLAAPLLGGYIGNYYGWRNIFWFLVSFGSITCFLLYFYLPETSTQKKPFSIRKVLINTKKLLFSPEYIWITLTKALLIALLSVNIAQFPLLYADYYGINEKVIGWYFMISALAFVIAGTLNHHLIKIFPLEKIMSNAIKYLFLSSLILIIIYCFLHTSALILQIIRWPTFFCCGLLLGNTTTRVVSAVKGLAASSSALMISLEMIFSFLLIDLFSRFYYPHPLSLAIPSMIIIIPTCYCYFRHHRQSV